MDQYGKPTYDPDGKQRFKCGFKIGGGIDQDPAKSPQGYPDKVNKRKSPYLSHSRSYPNRATLEWSIFTLSHI